MENLELNLKNVKLNELFAQLQELELRKRDLVVSPADITIRAGKLVVRGADLDFREELFNAGAIVPESGADYTLNLSDVASGQICDRLNIPRTYRNDLHKEGIEELFLLNVLAKLKYEAGRVTPEEEWLLQGMGIEEADWYSRKNSNRRNFLLRTYMDRAGGTTGYLRAFLSDRFDVKRDNFKVLSSVLEGLQDYAGEVIVEECYLSEQRMYVCFALPGVRQEARELLRDYRDPSTGKRSNEVMSGFILKNSETGFGSFEIQDRIVFLACSNGMLGEKRVKERHIGKRLEEGVIAWGDDTRETEEELVRMMSRDVVRGYLDGKMLESMVRAIAKEGTHELQSRPLEVTESLCKESLQMSEEKIACVCDLFMAGGAHKRSIDIVHAVTAFARQQSGDERFELEEKSLELLKEVRAIDEQLIRARK